MIAWEKKSHVVRLGWGQNELGGAKQVIGHFLMWALIKLFIIFKFSYD